MQTLLFPDPRPLVERLGRDYFLQLPERPGVYLMHDARDTVLYVGKAKNLRKRLGSYRVANPDRLPRRLLRLLHSVERIELQECPDEPSALLRESELLRQLKPKYNRAGTWPSKPRYLAWRRFETTIQFTITESLFSLSSIPNGGEGRREEVFDQIQSHPNNVRLHSLSSTPSGGEGRGEEVLIEEPYPFSTITELPAPAWKNFGPMGRSAIYLRAALIRLLWLTLHPNPGLIAMPHGWANGHLKNPTTLPCGPQIQETLTALETLLSTHPEKFSQWVQEKTANNLNPFDQAVLKADLEYITDFRRDDVIRVPDLAI